MPNVTVPVPDIGEFEDVEVIEILVEAGQRIDREDSLVTLESDKASVEIPCPYPGVVAAVRVSLGDLVSEGAALVELEVDAAALEAAEAAPALTPLDREAAAPPAMATPDPPVASGTPAPRRSGDGRHAEVVVLGAGPGGYTAAFRAADLGKQVVLVERYPTLGGVCLNVGCIPSKALLHVAEVIEEAGALRNHGVDFGEPRLDLAKLRSHKDAVVGTLTGGLARLAKQRGVEVVRATGRFETPNTMALETPEGVERLSFDHAIVAAGSRSVELPGIPHDDPRVMDSTAALELDPIPERLLVVGGGIIGLEMATVYQALGSRVTVVELLDDIMNGVDPDLLRPLKRRMKERLEALYLSTKVTGMIADEQGLRVSFEGEGAPGEERYDAALVAVGRRPNGDRIQAENAGIVCDERSFLPVDAQCRTNVPHIYAIGDIVGEPQLAHKATHEGKTAAEALAGLPAAFDPQAIPAVAYTDPEVAWMGLSEADAKAQGLAVEVAKFPWAASGRALGVGRAEGLTKLVFEPGGRLLGAGIVGPNAGELIAETVLALELGADAEDLSLTIHPHPTLSESIGMAAEIAHGTVTDLYFPKRGGATNRAPKTEPSS